MAKSSERVRVDPTDIRGELERVISSNTFARSERARGMLRYIVEQDLAGKADLLKGFSIAQDVFGKSDDFDPAMDAVVRVQAGRLRDQLAGYYEGEGANDRVEIMIPRGTYVPQFSYRDPAASGIVDTQVDLHDFDGNNGATNNMAGKPAAVRIEPDAPVSPYIVANVRRIWIVLLAIIVLLLLILFNLWQIAGAVPSRRPLASLRNSAPFVDLRAAEPAMALPHRAVQIR